MATSSTPPAPEDLERFWDTLDIEAPDPGVPSPPPPDPRDIGYPAAGHQDWADRLDEHFDSATAAPARPVGAARLPRRGVLIAGAAAAAAAVTAIAVLSDDAAPADAGTAPAETTAASSAVSPVPTTAGAGAGVCEARVEGEVITSAERGDTATGAGVILAFEAAYYLDRSGAKARAVTTPDAALPSAEAIQEGIDTVPRGSTHCVRITAAGPDQWAVELTEQRPGQPAQTYRQTITTTSREGRVLITGISTR